MSPFRFVLFGLIALFPAASAFAGSVPLDAKTGLWEVQTSYTQSGMPSIPSVDLSMLPPAQRAQIEALMQSQSGVPENNTFRTCVTEEDLNSFMPEDVDESCTTTIVKSTPKAQEIKVTCNGSGQGTGLIKVNMPNRTSMTSDMQMSATVDGQEMRMTTKSSGKWISDDCGDVTD